MVGKRKRRKGGVKVGKREGKKGGVKVGKRKEIKKSSSIHISCECFHSVKQDNPHPPRDKPLRNCQNHEQ